MMKKPYTIILVISMAVAGMYVAFTCSLGDISPDPPQATHITLQDVSFLVLVFMFLSGLLFCTISGIYWIISKIAK